MSAQEVFLDALCELEGRTHRPQKASMNQVVKLYKRTTRDDVRAVCQELWNKHENGREMIKPILTPDRRRLIRCAADCVRASLWSYYGQVLDPATHRWDHPFDSIRIRLDGTWNESGWYFVLASVECWAETGLGAYLNVTKPALDSFMVPRPTDAARAVFYLNEAAHVRAKGKASDSAAQALIYAAYSWREIPFPHGASTVVRRRHADIVRTYFPTPGGY